MEIMRDTSRDDNRLDLDRILDFSSPSPFIIYISIPSQPLDLDL